MEKIRGEYRMLVERAKEARERAYAPYSRFPVGAALLCEDGTIYTGCNVENASYGLTCCAERTAIFKAVSEGHTKFRAISVVLDSTDPSAPCGACRQVIFEFGPDIDVVMANVGSESVDVVKITDLIPRAFGPSSL
ncbi:MAG: cytidine deaminase [Candidatus Hydrogenedentota bacterium]|nr:MAG: cytidine deaminase [Candidatus Hydrogenedentota bacterium]